MNDTRKNIKVHEDTYNILMRLKDQWKKDSVDSVIKELLNKSGINTKPPTLEDIAREINNMKDSTKFGIANNIYNKFGMIELDNKQFIELLKLSPRALDIIVYDEKKGKYVLNKDLIVSQNKA